MSTLRVDALVRTVVVVTVHQLHIRTADSMFQHEKSGDRCLPGVVSDSPLAECSFVGARRFLFLSSFVIFFSPVFLRSLLLLLLLFLLSCLVLFFGRSANIAISIKRITSSLAL